MDEPVDMTAETSVAAVLAEALARSGLRRAFGIPGGGTSAFVVELAARGVPFVLTHGETSAAIMAATEAERSGTPGAVFTSNGPGAAAVMGGIAHAKLDRAALLVVTDRQPSAANRDGYHQWLDQTALFRGVAKASFTLTAEDTASTVEHALRIARSDPPGPVHLDVPAGLARMVSSEPMIPPSPHTQRHPEVPGTITHKVRGARRPLILAGLGSRDLMAGRLQTVAEGLRAPVLTTYKGKGAIDETSPWAAGIVTGGAVERRLLEEADLVISVGLDAIELFASMPGMRERVALDAYLPLPGPLTPPTHEVLGDLDHLVAGLPRDGASTWRVEEIVSFRREVESRLAAAQTEGPGVHPWALARALSDTFAEEADIAVDAGAHMLPLAQAWRTRRPGSFSISNGLATMGFGLPAAIARSLADPERRVVCCTGDGGLLMVAGELATAARHAHRLTIVVFDDRSLSLIRVKQSEVELGHAVGIPGPDWSTVAQGFGIPSVDVADVAQLEVALRAARTATTPTMIVVATDPTPYGAIIEVLRG